LLLLLRDTEEETSSVVCSDIAGDDGGDSMSDGKWLWAVSGRSLNGGCCSWEWKTLLVSMDSFSVTKAVCVTVSAPVEVCMIGSSAPDKGAGVTWRSVIVGGAGITCSSAIAGAGGMVSVVCCSIDVDRAGITCSSIIAGAGGMVSVVCCSIDVDKALGGSFSSFDGVVSGF
jgi:hypothetical protein